MRAVFDERALVVRPGLLVGPYDPTDRFTYWVDRFAQGGDIAVPGPPQRYIQFVDVRDAAGFMIRLLEDERSGIYDVSGLPETTTMESFTTTAREALAAESKIVWLDEHFLEKNGITGWTDLPLWLGPSTGAPGLMNLKIDRALAHGLQFRSLAETISDTRAWSSSATHFRPLQGSGPPTSPAGISRERERELLETWRTAHQEASLNAMDRFP